MEKMIQVDIDKCIGCRTCEVACSLRNLGQSNPTRSRIRIIRYEKAGQYHNYVPMVCQQCSDPLCVASCPVKALSKNTVTGVVEVDQDNCVGCRVCTITCPIGGISIDPVTDKAVKCDLCGGDPECVKYCDVEAIRYVPKELLDISMKRTKSVKMSELFALMQSLK
jgi:carbon-monoxide dehydrogenase iron sulfur subunit